jgi:hypothetical protein
VIEVETPDSTDAPQLHLTLGAEIHRYDVIIGDGAYTDGVFRWVGPSGFGGTWGSSKGPTNYRATGKFCATRIPA